MQFIKNWILPTAIGLAIGFLIMHGFESYFVESSQFEILEQRVEVLEEQAGVTQLVE